MSLNDESKVPHIVLLLAKKGFLSKLHRSSLTDSPTPICFSASFYQEVPPTLICLSVSFYQESKSSSCFIEVHWRKVIIIVNFILHLKLICLISFRWDCAISPWNTIFPWIYLFLNVIPTIIEKCIVTLKYKSKLSFHLHGLPFSHEWDDHEG